MKEKMIIIVLAALVLNIAALYGLTTFTDRRDISYDPNLKVGQYSDTNITRNAIIKDPRYRMLAFAEPPKATSIYSEQFASVIDSFKLLFKEKPTLSKNEHGTWLWTPIMQMTEEYMVSILDNAKKEGINVVYLSIDSYLDIFTLPEGEQKENKKIEFENIIDHFIKLANERGIEVDAESGWRNWAEEGHTYKPFAIVNFATNFNSTHQNKFRGIQYDIEPYLLDEYVVNKAQVLKNFVKLVDQTAHFLEASDLLFGVVIPEFYDKKDKSTPLFSYGGRRDSAFGHLLNVLENRPQSSIIIMSYRNFSEGKDGSIDISKNEMRTAELGGYSTKIILALETGEVLPDYVTFHNTSKPHFVKESEMLKWSFYDNRNFGGMAVHYANAFFVLR